MSENLGVATERFLEHRRALGRKYISEEHELRLLVHFAAAHGIDGLDQLTAVRCRPSWLRGQDAVRGASTTSWA
jgi:hypothetical protein